MEERKESKKQFNLGTILLLAIGSIFVAVAAIIFVVKAWPYLEHVEKVLLMMFATFGCFGLSFLADRKLHIKGSASAMYYLGTVLSGITMVAILDENTMELLQKGFDLSYSEIQDIKALATYLTMLVPVVIRLFKMKRGIDSIFAVALFDFAVYAFTDLITDDYEMISVIFCLVHSAILIAYERLKPTEEKSLLFGLKIVVMIHAVIYFIMIQFVEMIIFAFEEGLAAFILFLVLTTNAFVMLWYYTRNKSILSLVATLANLFCLTFGVAIIEVSFIPDVIAVEKGVLIFALFIYAMKPIFAVRGQKAEPVLKHVRFALNCLLMLILLWHNVNEGELINVLIMGVIGAVMLFWAVAKNDREYIVLAAVSLILLVLYMTRDFWMAISWWFYLMLVGIAMIVVAVVREKRSNSKEE